MMFKFHKTGASGGASADYLEDEKDHKGRERAGVEVLRGDPKLVGAIADSLDFKHRHTCAVIAWAPEDKPTGEEINGVLDDFERLAWAGLEPDRYAWSAVRHDEADDGVHVHILAARVDLETGKSLNIAPPGWHRDFYPWRDYHNLKHDWARPDDPARAREVQPGHQALIDADRLKDGLPAATNPKADITDYLTQQIDLGLINSRDDIVHSLQEIGQITRTGKDYISVKPKGFDRAIRLRGAIYDKQFTADTYRQTQSENDRGSQSVRTTDRNAIEDVQTEHSKAIQRRERFHRSKYGRTQTQAAPLPTQTLDISPRVQPVVHPLPGDWHILDQQLPGHHHQAETRDVGKTQPGATGIGRGEYRTSSRKGRLVSANAEQQETVGLSKQKFSRPVDHQNGGLSNDRAGNQIIESSQEYEFLRQRHSKETNDFDKAIERVGRTTRIFAEAIERFTRFIRELVEIIVENTRYRPVVGHSLKQSGREDGPVISKQPPGQDLDLELGE